MLVWAGSAIPSAIAQRVAGMSVGEKIGQLFVTYAYGATATTTDPAAVAKNQELYGVDDGAESFQLGHAERTPAGVLIGRQPERYCTQCRPPVPALGFYDRRSSREIAQRG